MKVANYTFLLLLTGFISSCKLDPPIFPTTASNKTTTTTTTTTGSTITATYYFKGTLGGQAVSWQVTDNVNGYVTGFIGNNVLYSEGLITGELSASIAAAGTAQPAIAIEFWTYVVDDGGYVAYFNNFVNTGTWAYLATDAFAPNTKALAINYTDGTGKQYSSIGPQSSTAKIISVSQIPAQNGIPESLKIKLTFNCILYPTDGTGNALTLSNAEATVLLIDYLVG